MVLKVAIVGMGPGHESAPWEDGSWQKWGLSWHPEYWARCDRLFQMHALEEIDNKEIKRILEFWGPVVMRKSIGGPTEAFPLEAGIALVGDMFVCSLSYMVVLAMLKDAKEIAFYGVTGEEEYGYQLPNLNYLAGFARGRGIKVDAPFVQYVAAHARYLYRYGELNGNH